MVKLKGTEMNSSLVLSVERDLAPELADKCQEVINTGLKLKLNLSHFEVFPPTITSNKWKAMIVMVPDKKLNAETEERKQD